MSAILDVIDGRARDLGGFSVRRVLPIAHRKTVGPFIFFDHLGPAVMAPGSGMDVRPHPHIGLATVTYLFEGRFLHRDSLGSVQAIEPGAVNWMTAGRGIVHSERSLPEDRAAGHRIHAIQSWFALPQADEECAPSFVHHPAASLPTKSQDGVRLRVIAGSACGLRAPVAVASPTLYVDVELEAGAELLIDDEHEQRAVYAAIGAFELDGQRYEVGRMPVLAPGRALRLRALEPTRLMLLGGAPLDGAREVWWNFVSSSAARIEQAKLDWREGRFAAVPGEQEFIPLPDR